MKNKSMKYGLAVLFFILWAVVLDNFGLGFLFLIIFASLDE